MIFPLSILHFTLKSTKNASNNLINALNPKSPSFYLFQDTKSSKYSHARLLLEIVGHARRPLLLLPIALRLVPLPQHDGGQARHERVHGEAAPFRLPGRLRSREDGLQVSFG